MHLSVHVDQISGHVTEVALKNNTRHSMPFSWHSVPAERLHRSAFFKATRYAASCTEKRTAPAQPHAQTKHGHTELTPLTTSVTYLQLATYGWTANLASREFAPTARIYVTESPRHSSHAPCTRIRPYARPHCTSSSTQKPLRGWF